MQIIENNLQDIEKSQIVLRRLKNEQRNYSSLTLLAFLNQAPSQKRAYTKKAPHFWKAFPR